MIVCCKRPIGLLNAKTKLEGEVSNINSYFIDICNLYLHFHASKAYLSSTMVQHVIIF